MEINRGDLVVTSAPGDFGKPRPALVVQSNSLNRSHATVIVALVTSEITGSNYRIALAPSAATGLRLASEIMVDKLFAVKVEKIPRVIGRVDEAVQELVDRTLALVLGLGEA